MSKGFICQPLLAFTPRTAGHCRYNSGWPTVHLSASNLTQKKSGSLTTVVQPRMEELVKCVCRSHECECSRSSSVAVVPSDDVNTLSAIAGCMQRHSLQLDI